MVNFILFCFSVIGMTNIIVDSNLFEPIRNKLKETLPEKVYEAFECHQCMGFWCGLMCCAALFTWNPVIIFMCGCAGSFLTSAYYLLTELVLSKTDFSVEIPEDITLNE
jgi:hypothetical protein